MNSRNTIVFCNPLTLSKILFGDGQERVTQYNKMFKYLLLCCCEYNEVVLRLVCDIFQRPSLFFCTKLMIASGEFLLFRLSDGRLFRPPTEIVEDPTHDNLWLY